MADYADTMRRTIARAGAKAANALAAFWSTRDPRELLDFERHAERQQLLVGQQAAFERLQEQGFVS